MRRTADPDPTTCPCGRPARYAACCGRYHPSGSEAGRAPTAEALMRSRYSAYVMGLTGYVLSTWHPATRPDSIEPDRPGCRWLGLDVKRHRQADADHAEVEFVARSKVAGRAIRLHEVSRFVRERQPPTPDADDSVRWWYVDGIHRSG